MSQQTFEALQNRQKADGTLIAEVPTASGIFHYYDVPCLKEQLQYNDKNPQIPSERLNLAATIIYRLKRNKITTTKMRITKPRR